MRLLDAVLTPRGHQVLTASSGPEALAILSREDVDIVLLDILMPGMDGYEVCRRIRADERTAFLPVVMITASGDQEKVSAIEAGADDFVTKPFDQAELLARVRSLVRIKRYHDTIERQAAELADWNRELEERVRRPGRGAGADEPAASVPVPADRRAVVALGTTIPRRATAARSSSCSATCAASRRSPRPPSPRRSWEVLREYHAALGDLVMRFDGTLERFTGDGLMVFFNDPVPVDDAPRARGPDGRGHARSRVQELAEGLARARVTTSPWAIGIAQGYATLGRIGFEGRFDYAAIGTVTNLAARLCAAAEPWQILVTQRVRAAAEDVAVSRAGRRPRAARLLPPGRDLSTSSASTTRGWRHERSVEPPRHRAPAVLDRLSTRRALRAVRRAAGDGCPRSGAHAAQRGRRVRRRRPVGDARPDRASAAARSSQAFEERFLFLLLLLRQPRLRMVYVTSMPIDPTIVEYYLALLPGVIPSHARARLAPRARSTTRRRAR